MTQTPVKKQVSLIPPDMKLADFARNRFLARPPAGTTLEDLLNPVFWAHVARQFAPGGGDIIEVHPVDGAYYAELFVAECRKTGLVNEIRLVKISCTPLSADTTVDEPADAIVDKPADAIVDKQAEPEGAYRIVYRGIEKKHTVTRVADNIIVSEGHATKQDAQKWIDEQELNSLTQ